MKECEASCGTPEQLEKLKAVIEESRTTPGCLMHILQEAQGIYGFLPMSVQKTKAQGQVPHQRVSGNGVLREGIGQDPGRSGA